MLHILRWNATHDSAAPYNGIQIHYLDHQKIELPNCEKSMGQEGLDWKGMWKLTVLVCWLFFKPLFYLFKEWPIGALAESRECCFQFLPVCSKSLSMLCIKLANTI